MRTIDLYDCGCYHGYVYDADGEEVVCPDCAGYELILDVDRPDALLIAAIAIQAAQNETATADALANAARDVDRELGDEAAAAAERRAESAWER